MPSGHSAGGECSVPAPAKGVGISQAGEGTGALL